MAYLKLEPITELIPLDTVVISDETLTIFTWIVAVSLCQVIDIFGIGTNIINIMCFVKQGFGEAINISLFGLAIADVGCLVTQIFVNISHTLVVGAGDLTFDPVDVSVMVAGFPHLAFSRVNNWITAIITLEKCLCISIPLKMKYIVTPQRVCALISCVYVIFIFSGAPIFAVNWLDTKFSLQKNRTILGLVSKADGWRVENITYTVNSFLLPFLSFIIIIICTIILVANLRKRKKWLKASESARQTAISLRDQKVAKMVVMISVLFIACFFPLAVFMLAVVSEPNLNVGGKLFNVSKLFGHIVLLLESVNSSANIFIYYHMSKKYRDTFNAIFFSNTYKPHLKK